MMGFIKTFNHFLHQHKKDIAIMERSPSWIYRENYQNVSEYNEEDMEEYIRDVMTGYLHGGVIYDRTQVMIWFHVIVGSF